MRAETEASSARGNVRGAQDYRAITRAGTTLWLHVRYMRAVVRSAGAAKLFGVEVLITGLRPEVARTFVALGEDIAGVTTLATLQSGVAHALRRGARV